MLRNIVLAGVTIALAAPARAGVDVDAVFNSTTAPLVRTYEIAPSPDRRQRTREARRREAAGRRFNMEMTRANVAANSLVPDGEGGFRDTTPADCKQATRDALRKTDAIEAKGRTDLGN